MKMNKKVKLQVAADFLKPEELIEYVEAVGDKIDIIELGTPYLIMYGATIIKNIKCAAPQVKILCDAKIIDAGYYEANELMNMGADYVTVLAVAESTTIKECLKAAKEHGKEVVVDMICIDDVKNKVKQLEAIGVQAVAVHTGVDQQEAGRTPLHDLKLIKEVIGETSVFVAGGIDSETLNEYMKHQPDVIIVGGGIFGKNSYQKETEVLYELTSH